jgi:hypothetical protein
MAPGASSTRPASHPVLPVRGPPNTTMTSSMEDHTHTSPVRHSCTATSAAGSHHRCQRVSSASEGRTVPARRRIAGALAMRARSRVEATPALRLERALHRVTVAAVRAQRFHTHPPATTATPSRTGQGS